MKRIELFGCPMDSTTMNETVEFIVERIKAEQYTQHVVVNAAKVVAAQRDRVLAESIRSCDLINIDGMAVVWSARMLGNFVPERVAGVDLFEELLKRSSQEKFKIFLLGATDAVVERVQSICLKKYPTLKIVGIHNGYFWGDEVAVVEKIKSSSAQLLFVAITSPKKENFINKWGEQLGVSFVMGVGGTFDVVAGKVRRAPIWMQKAGLEWLYRVIQEPRRMFGRYLRTNSKFIYLVLKSLFQRNLRRFG